MSTPLVPTRAPLPTNTQAALHAAHTSTGGGLTPAAIVAVVLAGLLILACLAWAAARWWAYEPHWLLTARHSCAEAGLRLSATWGELRDWMRLGH
jgi:hypothetical protein